MQTFTSGASADSVTGTLASMTGDHLALGLGRDVLALTDATLNFEPAALPAMTGVDVIDVSASPHVGTIHINDAIIAQSDAGSLTLMNGNALVRSLNAGIVNTGLHLIVSGTGGEIHLANGVNNTIYVADANTSQIFGGSGADTIYGGAGADVISGGKGADHFILSANANGSADTIRDFSVADRDVIDIASQIAGYDPTQAGTLAGFIRLTSDSATGYSLLQVDASGTGSSFHTAVILQTPVTQSLQDLVNGGNLIVSHVPVAVPPPVSSTSHLYTVGDNELFADPGLGGATPVLSIDKLVITQGNLTFTAATAPVMQGIDIIDVSGATHINSIQITNAMVAQSDLHTLVLENGTQLVRSLSAGITDSSLQFIVDGRGGELHLANGVQNVVHAAAANTSAIIGGSANDTLYGGAGADLFTGGKGADIFHFGVNANGAVDTVTDFSVAQHDVLNIADMLVGYSKTQSSIDDFVQLTTNSTGQTVVTVDRDGTGTAYAPQAVIILQNVTNLNVHDLLDHGNLVVN